MLKLCELVVRMSTSKPENMSPQLLRNSEVGNIQYFTFGKSTFFQEVSVLGEMTLNERNFALEEHAGLLL